MRASPSGQLNPHYKATIPAGTTINAYNSWGSLLPIYGKPGDNVVCTWSSDSFGPRGPLQCEGIVESTGQVLVYAWNFTTSPYGPTGTDLNIEVEVLPKE